MVVCPNCGASYEKDEPKCPYCEYLNYHGAEKEYLEKLDDLEDDLGDVKYIPRQEYTKEAKVQGKKIKSIVITAFVVVMIFFGYGYYLENHEYESNEEVKGQMLFERETFPKLDKMYENGEYDALLEFDLELHESKSEFNIYYWEHYDFLLSYLSYTLFKDTKEDFYNGEKIDHFSLGYIIGIVLDVKNRENLEEYNTEKDYQMIMELWQEEYDFLINDIGYTEQELDEIEAKAFEGNIISYEYCRDVAKERIKILYD